MKGAIMLQGTGSDVGKSLLCTGLARACHKRNITTKPFKAQNMSNNAAVIAEGGEIGRAQELQARAARQKPNTHMNPILLKPESESGAQLIVRGQKIKHVSARKWMEIRQNYLPDILRSFNALKQKCDLIIIEGAGSPAEINLREGDVANMGFAETIHCNVILIADIHRGGVMASIIGTLAILPESDRQKIKGFIINNFHGDATLFEEGKLWLEEKTAIKCLGILPHFPQADALPAEDSMTLERRTKQKHKKSAKIKIAIPKLSRIANFDDLDPLSLEKDVELQIVKQGNPLPIDADLILIPGTKATIADLLFLRQNGWDIDIYAHLRQGGKVLGLCGGFQMLGTKIHDPKGYEGKKGSIDGLKLLDMETTLYGDKILREVKALHLPTKTPIEAYEIHIGKTTGNARLNPFAEIKTENGKIPEGAMSDNRAVQGTYLHGLFRDDHFRHAWLHAFNAESNIAYEKKIENTLDALAQHMEENLDIDAILQLGGVEKL